MRIVISTILTMTTTITILPHDLVKIVFTYMAPIQTAAEIEELERHYDELYQEYLEEQETKKWIATENKFEDSINHYGDDSDSDSD